MDPDTINCAILRNHVDKKIIPSCAHIAILVRGMGVQKAIAIHNSGWEFGALHSTNDEWDSNPCQQLLELRSELQSKHFSTSQFFKQGWDLASLRGLKLATLIKPHRMPLLVLPSCNTSCNSPGPMHCTLEACWCSWLPTSASTSEFEVVTLLNIWVPL